MINFIQRRRLYFVGMLCITSIIAAFLIIRALQQNVNFYFTPTEVVAGKARNRLRIRVGGVVQKDSIVRSAGLQITFVLTDFKHTLKIYYTGILPDLFKEGQGVVALGSLNSSHELFAEEILAKHDENYLPRRLAIYDP